MVSLPTLIAGGIRATSAVSPALGGALAYHAFFNAAPRMRVHPRDAATHEAARTGSLLVRGAEVTTYEWGAGERAVLLLHGWRARASQFAPLVRDLVAEGVRVVAFDAPAHGESGGKSSDMRDWLDAAEQLQAIHGPFTMTVGHSLGALAALTAARATVRPDAVVAIAGAATPATFIDEFVRELGLTPATRAQLERRFRARLQVGEADVFLRYDAAQHPLPDGVKLLVVHDRADRRMPDADSLRLHRAHGARSTLLRTEGFGHSRILFADAVLDAILTLLAASAPDAPRRAAFEDAGAR